MPDPFTLILFGVAGLLLVGMVFSNRKRQKAAKEMTESMVPGVEVMTGSGIFGTIVEMKEEENVVLLEVAPGTVITVHRQALARVVPQLDPESEQDADGDTSIVDEAESIIDSSAEAIAKVEEDSAVLPASKRKRREKNNSDDTTND